MRCSSEKKEEERGELITMIMKRFTRFSGLRYEKNVQIKNIVC